MIRFDPATCPIEQDGKPCGERIRGTLDTVVTLVYRPAIDHVPADDTADPDVYEWQGESELDTLQSQYEVGTDRILVVCDMGHDFYAAMTEFGPEGEDGGRV